MLYQFLLRPRGRTDDERWIMRDLDGRESAAAMAQTITDHEPAWFADWIYEMDANGNESANIPIGDYLLEGTWEYDLPSPDRWDEV